MSSLAFYKPSADSQPIQVEVSQIRRRYCMVRAISGTPFVNGFLYPIPTDWAVVPMDSILVIRDLTSPPKDSLELDFCQKMEG